MKTIRNDLEKALQRAWLLARHKKKTTNSSKLISELIQEEPLFKLLLELEKEQFPPSKEASADPGSTPDQLAPIQTATPAPIQAASQMQRQSRQQAKRQR